MFSSNSSAVGKSLRVAGILLGIAMLIGAFGFIYTGAMAQSNDPHYGQLQTAQPANLSFQSLAGCASEFFMLDEAGNRTALADESVNLNFAQLRVEAVQLEFLSTGGCRVLLDLTTNS